ncbi:hypothetical protein HQ520_07545 [bacterium]|nr:hypothetical protein [bacterium]
MIGFEHEYDAAGNKRYQRSLHDPLDSQRYAYDSASRLLAYSRGFFGVGDTAPDDARFCDAPATTTWSGVASESALQREVWPPKRDPLLPCTSLHRNA